MNKKPDDSGNIILTINDLNTIVAEKLGYKDCVCQKATIGELVKQYHPKNYILGVGSVLSVQFKLKEEIK